jgi:hypothetical protein
MDLSYGPQYELFRNDARTFIKTHRHLVDMTGVANLNEVFFTNDRVPKNQIVGEQGQGRFQKLVA